MNIRERFEPYTENNKKSTCKLNDLKMQWNNVISVERKIGYYVNKTKNLLILPDWALLDHALFFMTLELYLLARERSIEVLLSTALI